MFKIHRLNRPGIFIRWVSFSRDPGRSILPLCKIWLLIDGLTRGETLNSAALRQRLDQVPGSYRISIRESSGVVRKMPKRPRACAATSVQCYRSWWPGQGSTLRDAPPVHKISRGSSRSTGSTPRGHGYMDGPWRRLWESSIVSSDRILYNYTLLQSVIRASYSFNIPLSQRPLTKRGWQGR